MVLSELLLTINKNTCHPAKDDMKLMTVTPPEDKSISQIIDANLDRAREGLRVIEDWCRYVLREKELVITLKDWRHQLALFHRPFYRNSRSISLDPGVGLTHPEQTDRIHSEQIIIANSSRVQEALRVIEEFSRINDPELSKTASIIRYGTYQIEQELLNKSIILRRNKKLEKCKLYLITSSNCNLYEIILKSLKAGAQMIQYRCKRLCDKEILYECQKIADLCKQFECLFIINDRIDIALATDADGVHLGQEDMPISIARSLLGNEKIIGKTAHSVNEIKEAEKESCDYLGIGPIYQSKTKKDLNPLGINYAKEAMAVTNLPWFAIGGINEINIKELCSIGVNRVAIASAIINSSDPSLSTKKLLDFLL